MALTIQQSKQIKDYLIGKIHNKLATYAPETNYMPFHFRLLGKDRMAIFSFIQSVNTMLGTSIFEQIGKLIAEPKAKMAIGQYREFVGYISSESVLTIDRIMRDLRSALRKPDKEKETDEILEVAKKGNLGRKLKKRVDLYIEMNGIEYYFEIKTAKPNINEFIGIKKQLLDWIAMRSSEKTDVKIKTIVAIPYNPYEPKPYERWTLQGLFDLSEEVLVGHEFWDLLGGENTYEDLLKIFEQAGSELYDEIDKKIKTLK
ncbi:MAG: TdeIII family type II restriction endonuclease [Atribacterota bacterium]|nr:TdeIII family type II restriction endonuclease [Atribacterota bacterium]MDD4896933.1 TdeIII family type II restriction endonuclease [Atribacterota bacterium]MDD5636789.1 TdeIII family type II restriction endonuclease [Atribacterota bacterium]